MVMKILTCVLNAGASWPGLNRSVSQWGGNWTFAAACEPKWVPRRKRTLTTRFSVNDALSVLDP